MLSFAQRKKADHFEQIAKCHFIKIINRPIVHCSMSISLLMSLKLDGVHHKFVVRGRENTSSN